MTKRPRTRLTVEDWAVIRTLWESGDYTFPVLSERFRISVSRLKQKSGEDQWSKGSLSDAIVERTKENVIESLARLGMPKDEWLRHLIDGSRGTKKLTNVKRLYKNERGETVTLKGRPVTLEQTIEVIDNETTFRYTELLGKVAGWYAAPKSAVAPDPDEEKKEIPVRSHMTPIPKKAVDVSGHS